MFKKNLNAPGKRVRFMVAFLLLLFAIWQNSWIALFFSIFTFFEAYMSWCIVYQLLGKSSCPVSQPANKQKPTNLPPSSQ